MHLSRRGVDVTSCSIEYTFDEKENHIIKCTRPDYSDYTLLLDDERVGHLVCIPSTDYSEILLELKKD